MRTITHIHTSVIIVVSKCLNITWVFFTATRRGVVSFPNEELISVDVNYKKISSQGKAESNYPKRS